MTICVNLKHYLRGSMDLDQKSKELLKRDLFLQGLLLNWQEKVLPSANSSNDALSQARTTDEQERQLSEMHQRDSLINNRCLPITIGVSKLN